MNIGLCSGRHRLRTNEGEAMDFHAFHAPVDDPTNVDAHEKVCHDFIYRFTDAIGPTPINLYITGLSPLLTSFLKQWALSSQTPYYDLVLWHWDREAEQYVPQKWAMIT